MLSEIEWIVIRYNHSIYQINSVCTSILELFHIIGFCAVKVDNRWRWGGVWEDECVKRMRNKYWSFLIAILSFVCIKIYLCTSKSSKWTLDEFLLEYKRNRIHVHNHFRITSVEIKYYKESKHKQTNKSNGKTIFLVSCDAVSPMSFHAPSSLLVLSFVMQPLLLFLTSGGGIYLHPPSSLSYLTLSASHAIATNAIHDRITGMEVGHQRWRLPLNNYS